MTKTDSTNAGGLPSVEQQLAVRNFLYHEAELLDNWELDEWLQLLTEDITYTMPVRITQAKNTVERTPTGHFNDDLASLSLRVRRLEHEYAWTENPPSRIRHFVSNVQIGEVGRDDVPVRSNVMLFRNREDLPEYDVISGERNDLIRDTGEGFKLAKREVLLDHAVLDVDYISTFL